MTNNLKPIIVWSVPRSTSTAFERAFIQRDDTHVLHEPYGEPAYYGPERILKRYSDDECSKHEAKDVRFSDITESILKDHPGKVVVVKDMGQYIVKPELIDASPKQNPTVLPDDVLRKFRHAFLIRTPQKSVVSYYRAIVENDCGDFGEFDPSEAGFVELKSLLDYVRALLPDEPVAVLDSEDLIKTPEPSLRAFCKVVGLPFHESMLSWEPKRIEAFNKWKGFHEDAQNSSGFQEVKRDTLELPPNVQKCIQENLPVYEYLRSLKLSS